MTVGRIESNEQPTGAQSSGEGEEMKEYTAIPIPYGFKAEGCTVVKGRHDRGTLFVKTPEGNIFIGSNSRHPVDMLDSWQTEQSRRAYCRISGVKRTELNAARKERKAKEKKEDDAHKMAQLRSRAKLFGYRLVKVKK